MRSAFVLALLFCMMTSVLSAQTDSLALPASVSVKKLPYAAPGKLNTTLHMGSQFSSFSGNGSAFSSWVMPDFSYGLTKKFMISAGIGYINTNLSNFSPYFYGEEQRTSGNFSTGLIYLSGRYLLNGHITVSGSAYKYFDLSGGNYKSPWINNNAQGINMSVDYKVSEGFHIQAGFGYHQNSSPYYYPGTGVFGNDPFNSSYSPFPGF